MTDTGNITISERPRSDPEVAAQQKICGILTALRRNQAALGEFLDVLQEARYVLDRKGNEPLLGHLTEQFDQLWSAVEDEWMRLDAIRAAG